jgi:hypothetical protein
MKKSFEYSKMCGADVCLGIRIRDTGRVYILTADASGFWAFVGSTLVYSHMHIRPKVNSFRTAIIHPPSQVTDRDFGNSGDHEVPVAQQRTEPKSLDLHQAKTLPVPSASVLALRCCLRGQTTSKVGYEWRRRKK